MEPAIIPIQDWLNTYRNAAGEFARGSLKFDPQTRVAPADEPEQPGAYVAILSSRNAVHLGLSASNEECRVLSRALLHIRADETLSEEDMADGMAEIMNILAGKVKAIMHGRDGELHLGLPFFVPAPIRSAPGAEIVTTDLQLGPGVCTLRVYRRQRAA